MMFMFWIYFLNKDVCSSQTKFEHIWKYFVLPETARGVAITERFAATVNGFQPLAFAENPTIFDVCGVPVYVFECDVECWIKTKK